MEGADRHGASFYQTARGPQGCFPPDRRSASLARVRLLLALPLLVLVSEAFAGELAAPADARQLVVVTTAGWPEITGTLRCFARNTAGERWRAVGAKVPVNVGRAGLAWGLGLHELPATRTPRKVEGDGKAPAGVFRLTSAFGYDPAPKGLKLPYIHARAGVEAVDDPRSRYYNRIVERARVPRVDWQSAEEMWRAGEAYRVGVVVAHNPRNQPGAGSCIFLHVWSNVGEGTAGCTAMPLEAMAKIQRWLDPKAKPVLMQAPVSEIPVALR